MHRLWVAAFRQSDDAQRAASALADHARRHGHSSVVRVHRHSLDPAVALELRNTAGQRLVDRRLLVRGAVPIAGGVLAGLALEEVAGPAGMRWVLIGALVGLALAALLVLTAPIDASRAGLRQAMAALDRGDTVITVRSKRSEEGAAVERLLLEHGGTLSSPPNQAQARARDGPALAGARQARRPRPDW